MSIHIIPAVENNRGRWSTGGRSGTDIHSAPYSEAALSCGKAAPLCMVSPSLLRRHHCSGEEDGSVPACDNEIKRTVQHKIDLLLRGHPRAAQTQIRIGGAGDALLVNAHGGVIGLPKEYARLCRQR